MKSGFAARSIFSSWAQAPAQLGWVWVSIIFSWSNQPSSHQLLKVYCPQDNSSYWYKTLGWPKKQKIVNWFTAIPLSHWYIQGQLTKKNSDGSKHF